MIILSVFILSACNNVKEISFKLGQEATMMVGDERKLEINDSDSFKNEIKYSSSNSDIIYVFNDGTATAKKVGSATIKAEYKSLECSINIRVIERFQDKELRLEVSSTTIGLNERASLSLKLISAHKEEAVTSDIKYNIISGNAEIIDNILYPKEVGFITIEALSNGLRSNSLTIRVIDSLEIELRSDKYYLRVSDSTTLRSRAIPQGEHSYRYISSDSDIISIEGNTITALKEGVATVVSESNGVRSNEITITVVENIKRTPSSIKIEIDTTSMEKGDVATISYEVSPLNSRLDIKFEIDNGKDNAYIIGNRVYALNSGAFSIVGIIDGVRSNILLINSEELLADPYEDVTPNEFYKTYTPAISYTDSYYRTKHSLMSGSIAPQDQAPTISDEQPKENGKLIRNTDAMYSSDGNTYYVCDSHGNIVNAIYKNGGYVTLEEVAAHVFAFGEIPANSTNGKNVKPSGSPWGKYLRLNHTPFSGDVSRFPYEPILPDISGAGGETDYFEMDLGTTGTDCDPNHEIRVYNDGKRITRGAARIVYTRYDKNGDRIIDINEKHLFYTYNHYNDFQEYLNYQGGWGEMFGNITGGGALSSRVDYNPTNYVDVIFKSFKGL